MHKTVVMSAEFRRIFDRTRREPSRLIDPAALTAYLRTPTGTWTLQNDQAYSLADIHDNRGCVIAMPVGAGKSVISYLAATVLNSLCHLIVVPAGAYDQTMNQVLPIGRLNWRIPANIVVTTYQTLSRNEHLLTEIMPRTIFFDEAQMLMSDDSGRARRVWSFIREYRKALDLRVQVASGSLFDRTFRNTIRVIRMALDGDSPFPNALEGPRGGLNDTEFQTWADALDGESHIEERDRAAPGPLRRFAEYLTPEQIAACDGNQHKVVQAGFAERMRTWPGFIHSEARSWNGKVVFHEFKPHVPDKVIALFNRLRDTWETPRGDEIADSMGLYRCVSQLSQGFYHRWVWPNGVVDSLWLEGRKLWRRFVRDSIMYNKRCANYTYSQVEGACIRYEEYIRLKNTYDKDEYDNQRFHELGSGTLHLVDSQDYRNWKEVEPRYVPVKEVIWEDDFFVDAVASWLDTHVGIAWMISPTVGERIFAKHRIMHYAGGMSEIVNETVSCTASVQAHGTGLNLQHFSNMLFAAPPTRGKHLEQNLGRMARKNQRQERIDVWLSLHSRELWEGFVRSLADADFARANGSPQLVIDAGDLSDVQTTADVASQRIRSGDPLWRYQREKKVDSA